MWTPKRCVSTQRQSEGRAPSEVKPFIPPQAVDLHLTGTSESTLTIVGAQNPHLTPPQAKGL